MSDVLSLVFYRWEDGTGIALRSPSHCPKCHGFVTVKDAVPHLHEEFLGAIDATCKRCGPVDLNAHFFCEYKNWFWESDL